MGHGVEPAIPGSHCADVARRVPADRVVLHPRPGLSVVGRVGPVQIRSRRGHHPERRTTAGDGGADDWARVAPLAKRRCRLPLPVGLNFTASWTCHAKQPTRSMGWLLGCLQSGYWVKPIFSICRLSVGVMVEPVTFLFIR